MPTYQYQCTECGEGLEAVQKFTDEALTTCPSCEGRLRKVFSAVGVVFKGSGFYRNDSRAGASGGAKSSSNASGESSSKESTSGSSGSKDSGGSSTKSDKGSSSGSTKTGSTTGSTAA
ncbi:FmdB family transcriptional regulator [Wenjunlia vitaminophila]|uniref:FmdB family transcriptional regulator n=1 Tax=Wenjunlia vitaminophila TaxID=76728 RepID=A0A0T6LV94_WENVI|nr:FmdB family zinc ribbon protein [Wenjunlia vitaminophila]KRV50011.1 FmdB family transcriptional regulator [Wenjunlia vitaminophila]